MGQLAENNCMFRFVLVITKTIRTIVQLGKQVMTELYGKSPKAHLTMSLTLMQ
jgi:hypothetical protein